MKEEQDIEQLELNDVKDAAPDKKQRKQRAKKPEKLERELTILFDSSDAMQMLHISESTLYRLRKNKEIPFKKIGKKYYYPAYYFKDFNKK